MSTPKSQQSIPTFKSQHQSMPTLRSQHSVSVLKSQHSVSVPKSQHSVSVPKSHQSVSTMKSNRSMSKKSQHLSISTSKAISMSASKSHQNSILSDKRLSQWEDLMRKFSEAHKVKCRAVSVDIPRVHRSAKRFPTGSEYEGTWDVLGMSGFGVYTFPNGVVYEGEFYDGMFHGPGDLRYPCGAILRGKWRRGILLERILLFADGLEYSESDWKYCRMPDRRFTVEYDEGLQAAGVSFLTADQPTRQIPPGFFDTGDGFYDPKTKVVYKADDLTAIIRSPSLREQKWIVDNCRTAPEREVGPREDLYEEWVGAQVELELPPSPMSRGAAGRRSRGRFDSEEEEGFLERMSRFESKISLKFNKRPFLRYNANESDSD